MTFILKQAVKNTKNGKWITDKNGVDITKLIIEPLVEKVIEILKDYVKECDKDMKNLGNFDYEEEMIARKTLLQMQRANEIIMAIKLKKVSLEILKYIAPHFNLKIDQIESDFDDE
jgi:hypothetical protein